MSKKNYWVHDRLLYESLCSAGIDISTWTLEEKDNAVTFSVWDFAGQTVYYNTHQVNRPLFYIQQNYLWYFLNFLANFRRY